MASFGHTRNTIFYNPADHTNNVTSTGPRSKCDQVVFEALCKACEIIVGSRTSGNRLTGLQAFNGSTVSNVTSTRFNLQVPEIHGIRDIMSQYKLHLHVPVRLDVYFQPADNSNSRILLERWCLEYRHCASVDKFLEAEGLLTTQKQDAMAQLRHVWKRVVIWLRTLYVFSRLLPTNSFQQNISDSQNRIGFSLYLNHDGTDDTEILVEQQGFSRQRVPSGTVTTPYGQLSSFVVYLPTYGLNEYVEHFGINNVPESNKRITEQKATALAPSNGMNLVTNRLGSPDPSHVPINVRSSSYSGRSQQTQQVSQKTSFVSFDPSNLIPPRKHDTNLRVQRRHTTIGSEITQDDIEKPPRVMSGLSLALMMANIDDNTNPNTIHGDAAEETGTRDEIKDLAHDKRRAALHQMPPHLLEQQHSGVGLSPMHQPSTSGEYGYGYNNHIPTSRIQLLGSQLVVTQAMKSNSFDSRAASPSPFSVLHHHNTPPNAAFLGPGISTPSSRPRSESLSNTPTGCRNRWDGKPEADLLALGSATPPFRERPNGFVQAASVAIAKEVEVTDDTFHREQARLQQYHLHSTQQLASLDLLHCSPFQLPMNYQSSLLSALPFSCGNNAGVPAGFEGLQISSDWYDNEVSHMPILPAADRLPVNDSCFYEDTMPFAVDLPSSALPHLAQSQLTLQHDSVGTDAIVGCSRAVATLAEKCAVSSNRLSCFENCSQYQEETSHNFERMLECQNDLVASLADQLEEFRSFNLSLYQEANARTDKLES